jgi:Thermophilic glucose-6-phosphate isomerase and related metalloenzymes
MDNNREQAPGALFAVLLTPAEYERFGALVTKRTLSQMRSLYADQAAVADRLAREDPLIYEVYELPHPNDESDLLVNITRLYPGKVGDEYYMTKGHFHARPDTAEAVIGLSGAGELVVQNRAGEVRKLPVRPGQISYAGGGWGHRVINTGDDPLVFLAISGANIVHDYETAERLNFREREN